MKETDVYMHAYMHVYVDTSVDTCICIWPRAVPKSYAGHLGNLFGSGCPSGVSVRALRQGCFYIKFPAEIRFEHHRKIT